MGAGLTGLGLIVVGSLAGFLTGLSHPKADACGCREPLEVAALINRAEFAGLGRISQSTGTEVVVQVVERLVAGTPDSLVVEIGDTSCDVFRIGRTWFPGELVLVMGKQSELRRLNSCSGSEFMNPLSLRILDEFRRRRVPQLRRGNCSVRFCEADCERGRVVGRGIMALSGESRLPSRDELCGDPLARSWPGALKELPINGCYFVPWLGTAPGNLRAMRRSYVGWQSAKGVIVIHWSDLVDASVTLIGSVEGGGMGGEVRDVGMGSEGSGRVVWEAEWRGELDEQGCLDGAI